MKIYVIRHGQVPANGQNVMVGSNRTMTLTEKGIQQAENMKKEVEKLDYDFVICSPLQRTVDTCNIVNAKGKDIIYDERIVERDCGVLEGKPTSSFDYEHYWNVNYELNIEGATKIKDFIKRVYDFLDDIIKKYPDKNILIVTHNGVCKVIKSYFDKIPSSGDINEYAQDNCQIREYEVK